MKAVYKSRFHVSEYYKRNIYAPIVIYTTRFIFGIVILYTAINLWRRTRLVNPVLLL
jgi:hypothetical protein